jgi:hypothetical protein
VPLAAGLKLTWIEQEAFTARLAPQVVVQLKSDGSVPLSEIASEEAAAEPVFFTVIV